MPDTQICAIGHNSVPPLCLQVAPLMLPLDACGSAYEGYLLSNVGR